MRKEGDEQLAEDSKVPSLSRCNKRACEYLFGAKAKSSWVLFGLQLFLESVGLLRCHVVKV